MARSASVRVQGMLTTVSTLICNSFSDPVHARPAGFPPLHKILCNTGFVCIVDHCGGGNCRQQQAKAKQSANIANDLQTSH
jgi:hypothetical protein